jgi:hypothetical protein
MLESCLSDDTFHTKCINEWMAIFWTHGLAVGLSHLVFNFIYSYIDASKESLICGCTRSLRPDQSVLVAVHIRDKLDSCHQGLHLITLCSKHSHYEDLCEAPLHDQIFVLKIWCKIQIDETPWLQNLSFSFFLVKGNKYKDYKCK